MSRFMIADVRTGPRPLQDQPILCGIFDGDQGTLALENGCTLFADARPNYHTKDGREFAEVWEVDETDDSAVVIGYTEI